MNTSIKTNQLEYSLNRDKFSEKYDIFCLETSDKYIGNCETRGARS